MQEVADHISGETLPLAVDLDDTLITTDSLHEGCLGYLKLTPREWRAFGQSLLRGKAAVKREIANKIDFDPVFLPYNQALLEFLRSEKSAGRRLGLFTASDQIVADKIAIHLGLFDVVCGSDGTTNLKGERKTEAIRNQLGERFTYAGDAAADDPIFRCAETVILVGNVAALKKRLGDGKTVEAEFPAARAGLLAWIKQLRIHHWMKNALVFVAPLLAFRIATPDVLPRAVALFVALGCLASATYIINDLLDLAADRQHRTKRFRPLAAGIIPVVRAALVAAILMMVTLLLCIVLPWEAVAALAIYLAGTLSYSFALKREPIIDVIVLAGLYTLRIFAGGTLLGQGTSPWLLTFSMLFFIGLAILKRYVELEQLLALRGQDAQARGYTAKDLPLLLTSGVASGFASIVIFSLYMTQEQYPSGVYGHPQLLWLLIPLILVWMLRVWHLAIHGRMNDDPLLFAFQDRFSLALGLCSALVVAGALS